MVPLDPVLDVVEVRLHLQEAGHGPPERELLLLAGQLAEDGRDPRGRHTAGRAPRNVICPTAP